MRLPILPHRLLVAAPLLLALSAGLARSEPVTVTLAENGVAHFPVVVATGATTRVRAAADDLAGLLQRITGAPFAVQVATNAVRGIQVGAAGDFTNLPPDFVFAPDHPLRREEYRIRTHAQGVWVIGATEQAASHAVWGLLDGLGYRLFFLTDTWEVVPEIR